MRLVVAVGMLGVCLLSQGCSLADIATHLVTGRIHQSLSDYQERKRDRQWAEDAWRDIQNAHPGSFSEDYALGFQTGFADFLYNGGDGEPPALAPERYRTIHNQSPEGYRAAEDWFAGYRHGAREAKEGDYRRLVTGPSSLSVPEHPPQPSCPAQPLPPLSAAEPQPAPPKPLLPENSPPDNSPLPQRALTTSGKTGVGQPVQADCQAGKPDLPSCFPGPVTPLEEIHSQTQNLQSLPDSPAEPVFLVKYRQDIDTWLVTFTVQASTESTTLWLRPAEFDHFVKDMQRIQAESRSGTESMTLKIHNGANTVPLIVNANTLTRIIDYLILCQSTPP